MPVCTGGLTLIMTLLVRVETLEGMSIMAPGALMAIVVRRHCCRKRLVEGGSFFGSVKVISAGGHVRGLDGDFIRSYLAQLHFPCLLY